MTSRFSFPSKGNSADKRFSGKHGYICQNPRINAESRNQTAQQKIKEAEDIILYFDKNEKFHGQINTISEEDRNGNHENCRKCLLKTKADLCKEVF